MLPLAGARDRVRAVPRNDWRRTMLDDVIEVASGGWGIGAAVVIGVGLLAVRGGRPLAKGAIRGYLTAADSVRGATDSIRGWTASAVEQAQDLYAESKAEVAATPSKS
jgi:hypothetical protein